MSSYCLGVPGVFHEVLCHLHVLLDQAGLCEPQRVQVVLNLHTHHVHHLHRREVRGQPMLMKPCKSSVCVCVCVAVPACCVVVVTIPCCSLYACSWRYLRVSWFLSRYCSICITTHNTNKLKFTSQNDLQKCVIRLWSTVYKTAKIYIDPYFKTGQQPLVRRPLSCLGSPSAPEQHP